jgi:hypothetical protein
VLMGLRVEGDEEEELDSEEEDRRSTTAVCSFSDWEVDSEEEAAGRMTEFQDDFATTTGPVIEWVNSGQGGGGSNELLTLGQLPHGENWCRQSESTQSREDELYITTTASFIVLGHYIRRLSALSVDTDFLNNE